MKKIKNEKTSLGLNLLKPNGVLAIEGNGTYTCNQSTLSLFNIKQLETEIQTLKS